MIELKISNPGGLISGLSLDNIEGNMKPVTKKFVKYLVKQKIWRGSVQVLLK